MPIPRPVSARAWAGTGPTLLARIRDNTGAYPTQAGLTEISYIVTNKDTDTEVETGTMIIGDVIYDTLQTNNPLWVIDTTGYNFRYAMASTQIPDPGHYRIDIKITPVLGSPFFLVFDIEVMKTYA